VKVVSFCLFGGSPRYLTGALRNAELLPHFYPGWEAICWVDPEIAEAALQPLRERSWRLVPMDGSLRDRRCYRMLVADLGDADVFVVRDIDSRPSERERAAVDAFLASDRPFHAMRDHPGHNAPIMAGMWGARRGAVRGMAERLASWESGLEAVGPVSDQAFMARKIWPHVRARALVHDSIGRFPDRTGAVDFPTARAGLEFVGEAVDEHDRPRPGGRAALRAWLAGDHEATRPEPGAVYLREIDDRHRGMFSVVNEVVDHLAVAERRDYRFLVNWRSCYEQEGMGQNTWTYYFEPCFGLAEEQVVVRDILPSHAFRPGNPITPRRQGALALPVRRRAVKAVIDRHLHLKPAVREAIDRFAGRHLPADRPLLGVHVRGPGRADGGARQLRERHALEAGVPLGLYRRAIDAELDRRPDARILVCSDSQQVVDACRALYGDRVVDYPASRTPSGEPHLAAASRRQGYKIGEDVLVEAWLLSSADVLIHGSSNVTNFVLCNNPALQHRYVYE
jgi:hypothetical protein